MGSLTGHAASGLFFLLAGLWHLYNNVKHHLLNPKSFRFLPWYPTSKFRYLEPSLIILSSSIYLIFELFVGPRKHHPFDADGTIPSYHLRNFEHSAMYMAFLVYAVFAILLDRIKPKSNIRTSLTELLAAMAFGQSLLNFRLHSTDHMGVEGQFHMLVQPLIVLSLVSTLMAIRQPNSFLVVFVRSASLLFQGMWLIITGFMLYTPALTAKGCFISNEEGHKIIRCSRNDALQRAKSLVNILFSWYLIAMSVCVMSFYLAMGKKLHTGNKFKTVRSDKLENYLDESPGDAVGESLKNKSVQLGSFHGPTDTVQKAGK